MSDIAIKAENVSMMFNLSREREERFKEYIINLVKGKLFLMSSGRFRIFRLR